MTIANTGRLRTAQQLVERFRAAGRPAKIGTPPKPPSPRHLEILQRSPQRWPVTRDALAAQLATRLQGRQQPSQVSTSYCGPAAFLYCLLEDRPDLYAAYALSLWMHGSYDFGSVDIDIHPATVEAMGQIQAARAAAPKRNHISELDWMTMAGLSASTRSWFVPGSDARPNEQVRSITYPWVMTRWFAAVGSRPAYDGMGIGAFKQPLTSFVRLMSYWPRHWLVLQIDSSLITGGPTNTIANRHWVVVDPHRQPRVRIGDGRVVPLGGIADQFRARMVAKDVIARDEDQHMLDWPIDLKVVTWGRENHALKLSTLGGVADRFYGGFAFPRIR